MIEKKVSSLTQSLYETFIVELNDSEKERNVECIHKGLKPLHVQFVQHMENKNECSYLTFAGGKIQKWNISLEENKTVSYFPGILRIECRKMCGD